MHFYFWEFWLSDKLRPRMKASVKIHLFLAHSLLKLTYRFTRKLLWLWFCALAWKNICPLSNNALTKYQLPIILVRTLWIIWILDFFLHLIYLLLDRWFFWVIFLSISQSFLFRSYFSSYLAKGFSFWLVLFNSKLGWGWY
jgi:hypothetical protein